MSFIEEEPLRPGGRSSLDEDIEKMRQLIFGKDSASTQKPEAQGMTPDCAKRSRVTADDTQSPEEVRRKRGKVVVTTTSGGAAPDEADTQARSCTAGSQGGGCHEADSIHSSHAADLSLKPPLSLSTLVRERERQRQQQHETFARSQWNQPLAAADLQQYSEPSLHHRTMRAGARQRSTTPGGTMAFEFLSPEEAYTRMVERHRRSERSRCPELTQQAAPVSSWAQHGDVGASPRRSPSPTSYAIVDSPERSPYRIGGDSSSDPLERSRDKHRSLCTIPATTRWAVKPSHPEAPNKSERSLSSPTLTRRLEQALHEPVTNAFRAGVGNGRGTPLSSSVVGAGASPIADAPDISSFVAPALRRTPSPSPPPPTPPPQTDEPAPRPEPPLQATSSIRVLASSVSPQHYQHDASLTSSRHGDEPEAVCGSWTALRAYYRRLAGGLSLTPPHPQPR